jgi:hypothetical protein
MPPDDCAPPDDPDMRNLEDVVQVPESMRFRGGAGSRMVNGQGAAEDVFSNPAAASEIASGHASLNRERSYNAETGKQTPSWQINLLPSGPMFLEIQTANPRWKIWDWWSNIEAARSNVRTQVDPYIDEAKTIFQNLRRQQGTESKFYSNLGERMNVQRVLEAEGLQRGGKISLEELQQLKTALGPDITRAAELLEDLWMRYAQSLGYTPEQMQKFLDNMPLLRKRGDLSTHETGAARAAEGPGGEAQPAQRFPSLVEGMPGMRRDNLLPVDQHVPLNADRIASDLDPDIKMGTLQLGEFEYDAWRITSTIMRKLGEHRYLAPTWNSVKKQFDLARKPADKGGLGMPGDIAEAFQRYARVARHIPDETQINLARMMANVDAFMVKASGGLYKGAKTDDAFYGMTQSLLGVNYWANMGFNVGIVVRNSFQAYFTSYPIVGERAMAAGVKWASRPSAIVGDEFGGMYKGLTRGEATFKLDVAARTGVPQQVRDMEKATQSLGMSGMPGVQKMWEGYRNLGWLGFHKSETYVRMTSFMAAYDNAMRANKKYLKSNGDAAARKAWRENSSIDLMVPENSPAEMRWMDQLEAQRSGQMEGRATGRTDVAVAQQIGIFHSNQSHFIYTRGNASRVLNSTVGRFLGQYGTWPTWYAHYLKRLVKYGSKGRRTKAIGRFLAINGAVGTAGASIFGSNFSDWTFFSPLEYSGGPMVQVLQGAKGAIDSGLARAQGRQPQASDALAASQLNRAWQQLTPGVPVRALMNTKEAAEHALAGDWKTAAKRFSGFQPQDESDMPGWIPDFKD